MLSTGLSILSKYAHFIAWKKVRIENSEKITKVPLNYRTGLPLDITDNRLWTTYQQIRESITKSGTGYGIGFVLTKDDPFFLLDIDNAWDFLRQQWSPLALALCCQLSGAAIEISTSNRGLHIIGSLIDKPEHRIKPPAELNLGIELYTAQRFIALTDCNTQGSAGFICDDKLKLVISNYFSPKITIKLKWDDEPVFGWRGPLDDQILITRALASKSARTVFGHASFHDLWTNNISVLEKAYPPIGYDKSYDASSADLALAQHLAFWTGKNHTRIKKIMLESDLHRDKWEREDYITNTIKNACDLCETVLCDREAEIELRKKQESSNQKSQEEVKNEIRVVQGSTFLTSEQQVEYFAGHVYVTDCHSVFAPPGKLYSPSRYTALFSGYQFPLDRQNSKVVRDAWRVITESQLIHIPKVHTTVFRPDLPSGFILKQANGTTAINIYYPQQIKRVAGNVTPFLTHIQKILPDERDQHILLSYMAACVQYQGIKFRWCILIQGVDGNGKTLLGECVAEAIGLDYVTMPPATTLTGEFNAWMYNKILVLVEDVYIADSPTAVVEALKPIIDRPRQNIRALYQDATPRDICTNFILNSNHKDAIRKTKNDRRFCIFYTKQQCTEDLKRDGLDDSTGYFTQLLQWLKKENGHAIVNEFLYAYAIPDELNPAIDCHRAPETSSTTSAIQESLTPIEQEIKEAIDSGLVGFRNGWISSYYLSELFKTLKTQRIPHSRRAEMLRQLGYLPHPGLLDGRATTVVMPDGIKSRLYIHFKSSYYSYKDASLILTTYTKCQNP